MPESSETPVPPIPSRPGSYLPRISYTPPPADPATQEPDGDGDKKSKKSKKADSGKDAKAKANDTPRKSKEKASKLAETPKFDTYEARQKARIIVGSALAGVLVLVGCILYWTFASGDPNKDLPDEGQLLASASSASGPSKNDAEAQAMLSKAELAAKVGNTDQAIGQLERITKLYPNTDSGRRAQEALERPKQGLPLFPQAPAVAAKAEPANTEPEPKAEPPAVVNAVEPKPTGPANPGAATDAQIVPPNAPAEPRKEGAALPSANVTARPLPAGFHARAEAGVHPSGWPLEIVCDRDGAPMVLVPGGTFVMGRDDGSAAEGPAHKVNLGTYYMDQHEVTVRQYQRFLLETGRKAEKKNSAARDNATPDPAENMPAVRVSGLEAQEYARWAGKSLPTEAQWEMAARTTDARLHPWGPGEPPWEKPRAAKQIDPVMSFPTDLSPYGAYDLAGNAWEWTADWFDPNYYQQFKTAAAHDPIGPARSKAKPPQMTIRGGSPTYSSTWRQGMKADAHLAFLGFRCALSVEAPTVPAAPEGPAPGTPPQAAPPAGETPPPGNNGLVPF